MYSARGTGHSLSKTGWTRLTGLTGVDGLMGLTYRIDQDDRVGIGELVTELMGLTGLTGVDKG